MPPLPFATVSDKSGHDKEYKTPWSFDFLCVALGVLAPFFGETLEAEIIYIYIYLCIYSKRVRSKGEREREREKGGEISNDITLACLERYDFSLSRKERERGKEKRKKGRKRTLAVGYLPAVKYEIKFIRVLAVIINRTIVAGFERASRVAGSIIQTV